MLERKATLTRETGETKIKLALNLDGTGKYDIQTGIKMLDHLLSQTAKHGRLDLSIKAAGDDEHHIAEDIAICFGQALNKALGEKLGIARMGDATVPMDEALAMVALDISGRGYCELDLPFKKNDMRGFHTDLVRHFLETLAAEGKFNLHALVLYGENDHHKVEAVFKALGRALDVATRIDPRTADKVPSTKKKIEK